eukprot:1750297-Heterocapsa_arctica.AAC.1
MVQEVAREDLGVLLVTAHGVRQASVRADKAPARVHVNQRLAELLLLSRTQRAVDARREGVGGLGVLRAEDRLGHQRVDATVHQAPDLPHVGLHQLAQ